MDISQFTPNTFLSNLLPFLGKNEKTKAKIRTTIIQFTAIGTRNSSENSGTKSDQKDKKMNTNLVGVRSNSIRGRAKAINLNS